MDLTSRPTAAYGFTMDASQGIAELERKQREKLLPDLEDLDGIPFLVGGYCSHDIKIHDRIGISLVYLMSKHEVCFRFLQV